MSEKNLPIICENFKFYLVQTHKNQRLEFHNHKIKHDKKRLK
jgi:hypothetical protein